MKKEIKFSLILDENNIPEKINWNSSDNENDQEEIKALMISVWDPKEYVTKKIDLWTKEMYVEEMRLMYFQHEAGTIILFHIESCERARHHAAKRQEGSRTHPHTCLYTHYTHTYTHVYAHIYVHLQVTNSSFLSDHRIHISWYTVSMRSGCAQSKQSKTKQNSLQT